MSFQTGSIDADGMARTSDGKLYVTLGSGSTIPSPTFTGNITGASKDVGKSGIPFIYVSSGSIGNNGALSAITALPTIYAGAYVYFSANAIAAGVAAGWYWTVFSSTTAGTIYNSTYTTGVPVVGTATAFATTGPGAFVSSTAEVQGPTITVPGGALGANGQIIAYHQNFSDTSSNSQRVRYSSFTGTIIHTQSNNAWFVGGAWIAARGATNRQVGGDYVSGQVAGATAPQYMTVDTTADTTVVFTLGKGGATANLVLEAFYVSVTYGA